MQFADSPSAPAGCAGPGSAQIDNVIRPADFHSIAASDAASN